jgi:hypothetical protein
VVLAAVKSNASAFLFALGAARVSSKVIRVVLEAREELFHAESYDLAQKLGWLRPRPPPERCGVRDSMHVRELEWKRRPTRPGGWFRQAKTRASGGACERRSGR